MKIDSLDDIRILEEQVLITPDELKTQLPLTEQQRSLVIKSRKTIKDIINKKDARLLVICGPSSIHDPQSAIEYAEKLKALSEQVKDELFLVMRVQFETPQFTFSWKGLINDPEMDNSFDTSAGLKIARQLLIKLTDIGIPLAFEAVDPNIPQYLGDLFSWVAIGEKAIALPMHREMASGLSMPIGFKNGADGNLNVAIRAIKSSALPNCFVGINPKGQICQLKTNGNSDTHLILREGDIKDCKANNIAKCEELMVRAEIDTRIMVDCTHANKNKDYHNQLKVLKSIAEQIQRGNGSIIGVILHSFLNEGAQSAELSKQDLRYGIAIGDACIGWYDTEQALSKMSKELANHLTKRHLVNCFAPIDWN